MPSIIAWDNLSDVASFWPFGSLKSIENPSIFQRVHVESWVPFTSHEITIKNSMKVSKYSSFNFKVKFNRTSALFSLENSLMHENENLISSGICEKVNSSKKILYREEIMQKIESLFCFVDFKLFLLFDFTFSKLIRNNRIFMKWKLYGKKKPEFFITESKIEKENEKVISNFGSFPGFSFHSFSTYAKLQTMKILKLIEAYERARSENFS